MILRLKGRRSMTSGHPLRAVARSATALTLALAFASPGMTSAQTVSATTAAGDVQIHVGKAATLPADFPDDVWLPDGQALKRVEVRADSTKLVFTAAVDGPALAREYEARMREAGWAPASVAQAASGTARAWEKDARAVIAVFSATASDGTSVLLQLLPRR
jgi:hypothetical protein